MASQVYNSPFNYCTAPEKQAVMYAVKQLPVMKAAVKSGVKSTLSKVYENVPYSEITYKNGAVEMVVDGGQQDYSVTFVNPQGDFLFSVATGENPVDGQIQVVKEFSTGESPRRFVNKCEDFFKQLQGLYLKLK